MTDRMIYKIVKQFRVAIEDARNDGIFKRDDFEHFPYRCCGDTSCLLAEYLLMKGQESIYVWGEDETGQTHAWLVIKDDRVNTPTPEYYSFPDEIKSVMSIYGSGDYNEPIDISHYIEEDLSNGLVIDITADQFGEASVFVGYLSDFYRRFEFRNASDYTGLGNSRLQRIYKSILNYL